MRKELVQSSKFLSLVLRHQPERIGLQLDASGWVAIDDLLACVARSGRAMSREELEEVVATNDKKRFVLSIDGHRIRAAQGHSLAVELGLQPRPPPDVLYHGTATRHLDSIREKGLIPGQRQHVHLSLDEETAMRVGSRHGKPVVLRVRAGAMVEEGFLFYVSENGVWLTDRVPARFLAGADTTD